MNLVTRLRMKALWLKHAYRFLWAHKPLCEKFAGDVLRIGKVHLCRSCVCAYSGIFGGILLVLLAPLPADALPGYFFAGLAGVLALSAPPLYKRLPRRVRDLLRFAAGALIPLSILLAIQSSLWIGASGLAALFAFWLVYFRLRKARKLEACHGCPELGAGRICSGFEMQAEHLRRFEREATELLVGTGYVPECLSPEGSRGARRR
jgi:hypothetical protein